MDDEVSDVACGEEGGRELRVRDTSLEPVFIGEGGRAEGETAGVVHAQGKALKGEWEAINTERGSLYLLIFCFYLVSELCQGSGCPWSQPFWQFLQPIGSPALYEAQFSISLGMTCCITTEEEL